VPQRCFLATKYGFTEPGCQRERLVHQPGSQAAQHLRVQNLPQRDHHLAGGKASPAGELGGQAGVFRPGVFGADVVCFAAGAARTGKAFGRLAGKRTWVPA